MYNSLVTSLAGTGQTLEIGNILSLFRVEDLFYCHSLSLRRSNGQLVHSVACVGVKGHVPSVLPCHTPSLSMCVCLSLDICYSLPEVLTNAV